MADGFFSFSAFLVFLGLFVGTGSLGIVSAIAVERERTKDICRGRERSGK
jgi:hypothetical protein